MDGHAGPLIEGGEGEPNGYVLVHRFETYINDGLLTVAANQGGKLPAR